MIMTLRNFAHGRRFSRLLAEACLAREERAGLYMLSDHLSRAQSELFETVRCICAWSWCVSRKQAML